MVEFERSIIREQGNCLLVRITGIFGKYRTVHFEIWRDKQAFEDWWYRDGNRIFCQQLTASEEVALQQWETLMERVREGIV
jgi:hypothetical protein